MSSASLYAERRLEAIAARWNQRAKHWNTWLEDPAHHLNEDGAYQRFLLQARAIIKKRSGFCARHGVLDAGCGTGLVLANVLRFFAWGIGVDISQEMLHIATCRNLSHAKFLVGDCFKLAEISLKAGVVLSRGVLLSHYGSRQAQALLEAAKAALLPQGFIIFDFLNRNSRSRYQHRAEHKTFFTTDDAVALAERAGFTSAEVIGGQERRVLLLHAQV